MTTADHTCARGEVELSVLRRSTHTIVRPRGEIDIATAPALRERLLGLLRDGVRLLIIDLSGISFCDAAGFAVLVGVRRRAVPLGITLRLASPRPQFARLLRLHGLDGSLTVYPAPTGATSPVLWTAHAPAACPRGRPGRPV
jgi:anti-anti-sigma factor